MTGVARIARCPHCGGEIRLTAEELADKRGFCAMCDARFDVRPELLDPLPYRRLARVELALTPEPPPSPTVKVRDEGGDTTIVLRHRARWPGVLLAPLCVAWWAAGIASGVVLGVVGVLLSLVTVWFLVGREEVVLGDRTLLWRRAVGPLSLTAATDVTEIQDVVSFRGRDSRAVALIRPTGHPLLVGRGLDLEGDVLDWLARRLRLALPRR